MRIAAIAALAATLALGACQTTEPTVVESRTFTVPEVPEALWNCPVLTAFPEVKTLTEKQVARLIVVLYRNNLTCSASLQSVRTFLDHARKTVSQRR